VDSQPKSQPESEMKKCNLLILLVGATGFEPATPCAQGRCATRLRYAPIQTETTKLTTEDTENTTRQSRYQMPKVPKMR
jgi:hypothetical protein